VTERDNQEVQETPASEQQYKRGTQLGTSKEQQVVRAEAGQGEGERVLQKGPQVLRPKYQDVAFSNGGNPKNNTKACPKLAAANKCVGPCACLIRAHGGARGREERRGRKRE